MMWFARFAVVDEVGLKRDFGSLFGFGAHRSRSRLRTPFFMVG
jgi:hypothetical protein